MINLENAEIVKKTCIHFYNFLRRSYTSRTLETQDGNITPGLWRAVVQGDTDLQDLSHRAGKLTFEAKELRNEFMRYFQSDEVCVPWQDYYT